MTTLIKLGCCAFNFGGRSLDDALRLVRDLGFVYVDVGASKKWTQVVQHEAATAPAKTGAAIRATADKYGLVLCELTTTHILVDGEMIDPNHPDAEIRKAMLTNFRGVCQCAAEAGFVSVMGVPGRMQDGLSDDDAWDLNAETLTQMTAIAREYGVQFNVEAAKGTLAGTPEMAVRLAQQAPGLGYTLDYAHYEAQGIPQREVAPVQEFATHMHGKQARPGYAKAMRHEGTIDFASIVHELRQRDWDGVICIECIGVPSDQPERPYLVYRDVLANGEVLPASPGFDGLPVYQTMMLAHDFERILGANATQPE